METAAAILVGAVISAVVYRIGAADGQAAARGERIKVPSIRKKKCDGAEKEKLQRGIRNILDYKAGGND